MQPVALLLPQQYAHPNICQRTSGESISLKATPTQHS